MHVTDNVQGAPDWPKRPERTSVGLDGVGGLGLNSVPDTRDEMFPSSINGIVVFLVQAHVLIWHHRA